MKPSRNPLDGLDIVWENVPIIKALVRTGLMASVHKGF